MPPLFSLMKCSTPCYTGAWPGKARLAAEGEDLPLKLLDIKPALSTGSLRTVWMETSNAFKSTGRCFGSQHSGGDMNDGGHIVTAGAQHWIVTAGDYMYQAGESDGMNVAMRGLESSSRVGRTRVGRTSKTDEEIWDFVETWNDEGGGDRPYRLITNSCQTFAVSLVHFLCNGEGRLPHAGGRHLAIGKNHFVVAAGVGEVACASFGGAKVSLSAPALGVQGIKGKGLFVQAEIWKAELSADTPLGRIGMSWGLNANTGAGIRDDGVEASILGFGAKVGKDGVGLQTPVNGADCCVM